MQILYYIQDNVSRLGIKKFMFEMIFENVCVGLFYTTFLFSS